MDEISRFQNTHGAEFASIIGNPAFQEAMLLLNLLKIKKIQALSDADIEANGKLVLADFRGHLQHESDLYSLSLPALAPPVPLQEEYQPDVSEFTSFQPQPQVNPTAKRTRKK